MPLGQPRRGQLLGYVYASPLVRRKEDGRRERMDQLGTYEELKMIRKKLRESGRQIRFRAEVAKPANLRELLNSGCRMLHYTGHGNNEFLAFESNQDRLCGVMEPLHVKPLKNLFQAGGVRTELVFISSCSSEMSGKAFVEAGVPHVVAVKREESVTDQAAQQFANQFYDALMSKDGRYTVRQAFDIALNTVNADNRNAPPQGDHFLLLPPDGDHDVRIFDTLLEGDFVDETRLPPPRPRCVKPVPFYKGLEELQRVVEILVDPVAACVTITGEHGSGKTEKAIQACDYVRMRHHFDSVLWADVKKAVGEATAVATNMWAVYEDPCRLIGMAVGMPHPGPNTEEELIQFLFKNPTPEGGRQCQKVLLVLEDADSLFEGGGDARDRLIVLLSSLCSMGEHLKLMVTSEQSLLRDTNARFRHGSERVARVKKLRPRDAAQLLVDKVPTRFTKTELGLPSNCTRDDILAKLEAHPVLQAADGHPGTLLRLAPLLEDHRLNDACVLQRARRHRREYQCESSRLRATSRASSTNSLASEATGGGNGGNGNGNGALASGSSDVGVAFMGPTPATPTGLRPAFSHDTHFQQQQQHHQYGHQGNFHEGAMPHAAAGWGGGGGAGPGGPGPGGGEGGHFLFAGGGMNGVPSVPSSFSGIGGSAHGSSHAGHQQPQHHRRHSAFPTSPTHHHHPAAQQPRRRMTVHDQQIAVEELEEPDPPTMTAEEKRAWDTARNAALIDRGCRLVWVKASANAAADGWRYDGSGSGSGGEGGGGGAAGGEAAARYDCVPWDYLREGLKQHLCGQLTIPSNQYEVVDEGPYGWVTDEFGGGGGGAGGMGEGNGYGAVNTPQVRCMNEEELAFVRGVLKTKQEKVRKNREKVRRQRAYDGGGELGSAAAGGGGGGDEGGSDDVISLDAFVEFSLWWAPLMRTLYLLRNDWASMDPVRVHGFIGRLAAERELQQKERGTFLLRFSESKQGTLVVSFTEHVMQAAPGGGSTQASPPSSASRSRAFSMTCVKHCLVEVRRGGRCFIEVEQGKTMPYNSLHDLVRACSSMQTLYPDVPKDEAFYESAGPRRGVSDIGSSMYPPDNLRGSGPVGGGGGAGTGNNVVTLEEWGSRPIDMVLVDADFDPDMSVAAPV